MRIMTWTLTGFDQSTLYCGTPHLHVDYQHRAFYDIDIGQRCVCPGSDAVSGDMVDTVVDVKLACWRAQPFNTILFPQGFGIVDNNITRVITVVFTVPG